MASVQEAARLMKEDTGACSHGGVYSVNHETVKVDFSSSLNPLGFSSKVADIVKSNLQAAATIYPDPECRGLKESLSDYLHVDQPLLLVGNGSLEIIHWFASTFAKNRVVIPSPTFCEYELASAKSGASVSFAPLDKLDLDADSIIKKARGADAIFLCNPNNPTGILSTKSVKKIIESVSSKTSAKIMLDECFIELVDSPEKNSMIGRVQEFDNLVIIRSLTKSFAMAGLRLGYSVCNPKLAKKLEKNKVTWNVNGLAQIAGVAALGDMGHLERARKTIKAERGFMQGEIKKKTGCFIPQRSDANYFLIKLRKGNSTRLRDLLLKESGVLVRDCSTFTGMGSDYVRVAVKTRKENLLLLQALENADGR